MNEPTDWERERESYRNLRKAWGKIEWWQSAAFVLALALAFYIGRDLGWWH